MQNQKHQIIRTGKCLRKINRRNQENVILHECFYYFEKLWFKTGKQISQKISFENRN